MNRVALFLLLLLAVFVAMFFVPHKTKKIFAPVVPVVALPTRPKSLTPKKTATPAKPKTNTTTDNTISLSQAPTPRSPADPVYGSVVGMPILMFHRLAAQPKDILEMTPQEFRLVLKNLRDNNFCPVSLQQYVANRFPKTCEGKKIFAATFDDSHHSQVFFDSQKQGGALSKTSSLGIWKAVFPKYQATFFINLHNGSPPFSTESSRKLKLLEKLGQAIENHTVSHLDMSQANPTRIAWEVGGVCRKLARTRMMFAYPFGLLPPKPITEYNTGCEITYAFSARSGYFEPRPRGETETKYALLAPLPSDARFKELRFNIPRININSLQDLQRDVLKNPGVYRLSGE